MKIHTFISRDTASELVSGLVADTLSRAIAERSEAYLAVPGGTTPAPTFERLAKAPLDWQRVSVSPGDERQVAPDHPDSNERLIRTHLFQHRAAAATFRSLDANCANPPTYDCVWLGMGEDGHIASLFPDAEPHEAAFALSGSPPVIEVRTAASPYVRMSLSLSALLASRRIVLLAYGAALSEQ